MCASNPALDARSRLDRRRLIAVCVSGLAVALVSLAGFGLAHALIIMPIWSRLIGELPFVLLPGAAMAWAFDDLVSGLETHSLKTGVQFGGTMFASLAPSTVLDTGLRISGLRRADSLETTAAFLLACATGALAGWMWTRRPRGAAAFAAAATMLLVATHGPLPIGQSTRGLWLSFSIAPICLAAGGLLAESRRFFHLDTP